LEEGFGIIEGRDNGRFSFIIPEIGGETLEKGAAGGVKFQFDYKSTMSFKSISTDAAASTSSDADDEEPRFLYRTQIEQSRSCKRIRTDGPKSPSPPKEARISTNVIAMGGSVAKKPSNYSMGNIQKEIVDFKEHYITINAYISTDEDHLLHLMTTYCSLDSNCFTQPTCVICMDKQPTYMFDVCKHLCICGDHMDYYNTTPIKCPLCREVNNSLTNCEVETKQIITLPLKKK
jgi:hypothetical protein